MKWAGMHKVKDVENLLKDNQSLTKQGYEYELGVGEIPKSVTPYISCFYGTRKHIERLLSIKLGKVTAEQVMDYVDTSILQAVSAGMQFQKEKDNAKLVEMQTMLERLIKKDGKAQAERKRIADI